MHIRKSAWLLAAMCFFSSCAFAIKPNGWAQLASMASIAAAFIGLILLVVQAAIEWRDRGAGKLLPCLLILTTLPIAIACGHAIRNAIFSHDIDRWNEAAAWVKTHNRPDPDHPIQLPPQYADLAYGVFYTDDGTCGLMIDFFWGGAFPVKHTVRRYATSSGWTEREPCHAGWTNSRNMSGNWYELSD